MRQAFYFVLCAVLLTFSAVSSAATKITYYYGKQGDWITSRKKNPDAACMAILSESPEIAKYKHVAALGAAGSAGGACIGDLPTGTRGEYGYWVMTSANCEHGSADGLTCNPPPEPQDCSNLSPGIFKSPSGPIINSGGRNYIATGFPPGASVCFGGCSYSIGSSASSCYKDIGSGTSGYCNYIGTGTGDTCTEPDAALGAPGDALNPPDTPDVPPSDPNDPCAGMPGYSWSGTTCVKVPDDNGSPPGGDTGGGDSGGNNGGSDGGSGGGNSGGGDSGGGNNGGGDGSGNGDGDGNGSGSGDSGGSSGGGSGNGNGSGDGDGEEEGGSGPGFCDGDDCGFVAPGYFDGAEKIPGFDESFKRVYDGVLNSPIGSAVTGIAFPSGGGVCPSGSVELFGKNIVFDGHCTLWPQISGIFTALMIAVWSLLAVRIVLSS
ncbi:hypothetical protein [Ectopseudomonas mendocina]|uniref:hypothetical protein n=1 Tax=Ectopseudomonas mendocina TaxID=300 RepID=UPI00059F5F83|nr:hypothetical protein [Pseudomonas mendocina]